jgi:electron transfer flavoprotein-quinone oxidoreductase
MTSGRLAAETLLELDAAGLPASAANLARYKARLEESIVIKDLKKYRNVPDLLENHRQFLEVYPNLINAAAHEFFTVDGRAKADKEKAIVQSFRARRGLFGLLGDAYRLWRATR